MKRPQSIRLLTVVTATTLLAGLLALIGIGIGPATANHGSLKLEVYREFTEVTTGAGKTVTLTARLVQSNGAPPSAGAGVEVDWEVEGGRLDQEGGAATPGNPDAECVTKAGTANTFGYPTCSVTFPAEDNRSGVSFVRAWIDHDGLNENGTEFGGTEADFREGRLSDAIRDCFSEAPTQPAAGDNTDGDYLDSDEAYSACTSDDDGPATPGRDAEFDETDVVKVSARRAIVASRIECPELTAGATGQDVIVSCTVKDADDVPVPGVHVDGEHLGGANDPDGDGTTGTAPADYLPADDVVSNSNGIFRLAVDDGGNGETGFATVCAWIDLDHGDDGDSDVPVLDDPTYVHDDASAPSDGGNCADEPNPSSSTPPNDSTGNEADKFRVKWEAAELSRVDVSPETDRTQINTNHTLTAQAFDQFGNPWNAPATKVNFEFLAGSPGDTDGNGVASPDGSCTTAGNGADGGNTCTVTYTKGAPGRDLICAWLDGFPINSSCLGEKQPNNEGGDHVDVVVTDWFAPPVPPPADAAKDQGYVFVAADGGIFNYGTAQFHGSTGDIRLNAPIIGIAYMPGGEGYWLVAKDGGVFTFGKAGFHGSMGDKPLNAPVLGIESTPSGKGYWLFAADGGIFSFGDATFHGSTGNMRLNAPMVGMAVNEKGTGYWLVAQDGGVFNFDATFHGSTGDMKLNEPVFDMAPAAGDKGYWLVARDGGVFTFGDIAFYGSAANVPGRGTVVGMGDTPTGNGYWIGDVNGKAMPFGDARFLQDASGLRKNAPMVGFASVQPKLA